MKATVYFTGINEVVAGLNKRIAAMKEYSFTGLEVAAQDVLGKAVEITPRDTGNLRASSGVSPFKGGSSRFPGGYVVIYYSAFYAPYVHEINKNYKVGQWKFLETALKQNQQRILDIITYHARKGLA
jgi:hypothetical protein